MFPLNSMDFASSPSGFQSPLGSSRFGNLQAFNALGQQQQAPYSPMGRGTALGPSLVNQGYQPRQPLSAQQPSFQRFSALQQPFQAPVAGSPIQPTQVQAQPQQPQQMQPQQRMQASRDMPAPYRQFWERY